MENPTKTKDHETMFFYEGEEREMTRPFDS